VAPGVENYRIISAKLGYVVLSSGTQFTIDLHDDDLINFAVGGEIQTAPRDANGNKMKDRIKNTRKIVADTGTVIITAYAAYAASGVVDGTIDGGTGLNALDYSNLIQPISVSLENNSASLINGGGDNGISNIDVLKGSQGSDTLIGKNQVSPRNIIGTNGGTINSTFSVSSNENLTGGNANDTFSDLDRGFYTPGTALTSPMNSSGGFNTYVGIINNVNSFLNIQLFISPENAIVLQDISGIQPSAEPSCKFFEIINHGPRVSDLLTYASNDPLAGSDETHNLLPANVFIALLGQTPLNLSGIR
jgi:hypothetical protein